MQAARLCSRLFSPMEVARLMHSCAEGMPWPADVATARGRGSQTEGVGGGNAFPSTSGRGCAHSPRARPTQKASIAKIFIAAAAIVALGGRTGVAAGPVAAIDRRSGGLHGSSNVKGSRGCCLRYFCAMGRPGFFAGLRRPFLVGNRFRGQEKQRKTAKSPMQCKKQEEKAVRAKGYREVRGETRTF